MKKMTLKNENYKFNQVVKIIESTKERVYKRINEELIEMYFSIGEFISKETKEKDYGDLFIEKLAIFFKERYPELKGFSETNLYRMKKFYELYFDNNDVKVLLPCICWSNHVKIMSSCKNMEERIFYMQMCIKDRLSKRELIRQIDSSYYERYVLSNKALMPSIRRTKKATKNIFLDQYVLDFLNLTSKEISESELEKSIVDNMRDFILEIGKDFTFIKEQYPIEVGDQKFYVDLLFIIENYHVLLLLN